MTTRRWTLVASILGVTVTVLDSTVVLAALPALESTLGIGLAGQQWVVNAYLLVLAALLPLGGGLADRHGRRRMYVVGLTLFGAASMLCGLAPTGPLLIAGRAAQGVGAALVMPTTLALIRDAYPDVERAGAIAVWAAWSGIAAAIGPLVGGWLVEATSWRWVFFLNLPLVASAVLLACRRVPESRDATLAAHRLDLGGAALAAATLGGLSYLLVEGAERGWRHPPVLAAGLVAVLAGPAFLAWEARQPSPMLPLSLLRNRAVAAANAVTLVLYGAFQAAFFLLQIHLQTALAFSPLAAGAAFVPVPLAMLLFGRRLARLARHTGPRLPLAVGPGLVAAGLGWLAALGPGDGYLAGVLPGVTVFGLGLAVTVPVLTDTAVGAAPAAQAATASALNNVAARAGALLAVAVAGLAFGAVFRARLADAGLSAAAAEPARDRPTAALALPAYERAGPGERRELEDAFFRAYGVATGGAAVTAASAGALALVGVPGPLWPPRSRRRRRAGRRGIRPRSWSRTRSCAWRPGSRT